LAFQTGRIPLVELTTKDNQQIIKITISPSSVPISNNGKYYIRTGSTVQELTSKNLADFLVRKTGMSWDNTIEEKADYESLDISTIETFKALALERIPGIVQESDLFTLLTKLNLIENGKLKRAAVLLFGMDTQRLYSHATVKIGKFLTDTDIQSTDIITGNIFKQLENTLETLRSKYLLSNISFEGIRRRDRLEYPYEALREAIINALIHRDYNGFSQIMIKIYADKMIIMNEGGLPPEVPAETLKKNHLSKPRNKLLADVLYFAGYIESWGRGTIKIVEQCLEQGLPEPDFQDEHGVMTVTFYKDKWNEDILKKMKLNERQVKAILYVKDEAKITNKEYQYINNVSERTSLRDLENLVQKEIFIKKGKKKGVYYALYSS
jgi:ATP-dependent DNA helicase RecG